MFLGVISREEVAPFTRGMSTQRWIDEVPIEWVQMCELWVSQRGVQFAALINPTPPVGGDPMAHIVAMGRKLVIEDGHTRIVREALSGAKEIQARVLRRTTW